MMAWPDGARRLIGEDGIVVHIEPTLWDLPGGAIGHIDASVPVDRVIVLPPRDPREIPQASPSATPATGQRPRGVWSKGELAILIGSIIAASAIACFAGLLTIAATQDSGQPDDLGWGVPVGAWGCVGLFLVPLIVMLINRRRRRRSA